MRLQVLCPKNKNMVAMQRLANFMKRIFSERPGQIDAGDFGSHAAPGLSDAYHLSAFRCAMRARQQSALVRLSVKVIDLAQHFLVHHILGHTPGSDIAARSKYTCRNGIDALVGQADVMRGDYGVLELE